MNTNLRGNFALPLHGFALDVAFEIPGRGITAITGVSGSGKTSLLRCIAGLTRAKGALWLGDECWQDDAARRFVPTHERGVGFVFQEASLFPHLSVRRNFEYALKRVPANERRIALTDALTLLDLSALLERQPDTLSGGERQRVAIARALLTSPRLLLMDEPLASLDLARKREFFPYLERLHDDLSIPVVYVTHARDEIARLADHLLVLDAGRISVAGPLQEVLTRLDLPLARHEDASVVFIARVVAHDAAFDLTQLTFPGGTLYVPGALHPAHDEVRVRIQARDVILSRSQPHDTSVLNVFAACIEDLQAQSPSQMIVRLDAGGTPLLARITRRSCETLALHPGQEIYAQVKSVALV